ncbi:MAG: GHKL domain-containing protein [Bacteroidales bacterium]|nr:GHKL domain-containing protein [Bacteroidales bacterium]
MASRYYLQSILFWTLVIAITTLLTCIVWVNDRSITVLIGGGLLLIIEVVAFVINQNAVNRKIASFFNALQNYDTSIKLPAGNRSKTIKELHDSLNHVVSIFQDVKMEYAAREQLFLAMIEHSSTGFISIDDHGDFEIMNQAARNLLGTNYTSNLTRLKSNLPELHQLITHLEPGEVKSCKIEINGGMTIIQVSSAELRFRNQMFTLLSLQDIKNEIDAKEMESWQKLIRIMNHEIMNSIAPIISVSKSLKPIFLKNNTPVEPSIIDEKRISDTISGLEIIESMSSGLKNFVGHYRKLSQIPEPEKVSLDVMKWSGALKSMGLELIPHDNTDLDIVIQDGVKVIYADEGLLNQVMINLIKNAEEALILTKRKKIKIVIGVSDDGKTAIRVINNGEPISADFQDKFFVPFFTTKESGAGIGLFLSRQIISMHKGSISAFTNQNTETVFEIILP